ncbi:MAG: hypothetical protein MUF03_06460, partial [Rubrivivax sp.]|nr:hypothetical protein [Rubrivivax sp.]
MRPVGQGVFRCWCPPPRAFDLVTGRVRPRRGSAPLIAAAAAALLAGCGGGGGGDAGNAAPVPQPQPQGELTASAKSCRIADGAGSCKVTLTATTSDVTGAAIVDDNGDRRTVQANARATLEVTLAAGESKEFRLEYDGILSEPVTVRGVCAQGTYVGGTTATPRCEGKLEYEAVVYGDATSAKNITRFKGQSCAAITIEVAENATPYQAGFLPLANRWIYTELLPSGRILKAAESWEADARLVTVINPVTNSVSLYNDEEGPAPSVASKPEGGPVDDRWQ